LGHFSPAVGGAAGAQMVKNKDIIENCGWDIRSGSCGELFTSIWENEELALRINGNLNLRIWVSSWFSSCRVRTLEPISKETLVTFTLSRWLIAGGTEATFWNSIASGGHTVALQFGRWFTVAATLL
jgi:hypothetical protein